MIVAPERDEHLVQNHLVPNLVARIRELETALKKLSENDYGVCEECGDNIGVARLKANPSARLCVLCQSEVEDGLGRRCA